MGGLVIRDLMFMNLLDVLCEFAWTALQIFWPLGAMFVIFRVVDALFGLAGAVITGQASGDEVSEMSPSPPLVFVDAEVDEGDSYDEDDEYESNSNLDLFYAPEGTSQSQINARKKINKARGDAW